MSCMLLIAFSPHQSFVHVAGNLNVELTLTDRTYVCKKCGMIKNRALNAAIEVQIIKYTRREGEL